MTLLCYRLFFTMKTDQFKNEVENKEVCVWPECFKSHLNVWIGKKKMK